MLTATRIDFEILRMTMFKVKFGAVEKSIWVLEKSLKFVSEKGYSCLACTQTLVVEFCPTALSWRSSMVHHQKLLLEKVMETAGIVVVLRVIFFWEIESYINLS